MRRFKVIALSCGTEDGRVIQLHDILSEDMLQPNEADRLVQEGFLKEITASETPKKNQVKKESKKVGKSKTGLISKLIGSVE